MTGLASVFMATETWATVERPILEYVRTAEETGLPANSDIVAEALGMDRNLVRRTITSLVETGYLKGLHARSSADTERLYVNLELLERGRREVGQWPRQRPMRFLLHLIGSSPSRRTSSRRARSGSCAAPRPGSPSRPSLMPSWWAARLSSITTNQTAFGRPGRRLLHPAGRKPVRD